MNTYLKFAPNCFVAKCTERHHRGEVIQLSTKYGKEHECEVHNFLGELRDGTFVYSITRTDGFNSQEYAKKRAERIKGWAQSAENKSNEFYKASQEGRDFLALCEPIKVGHHSEKRHRKLIERNYERMGKSVKMQEKAEQHLSRAEYWESKGEKINLSMPESLDFFEFELEKAREYHEGLKSGKYPREHDYTLTYANNKRKETEKNYKLAEKLWKS
jgi:Domain of unknown function (DUF3560)